MISTNFNHMYLQGCEFLERKNSINYFENIQFRKKNLIKDQECSKLSIFLFYCFCYQMCIMKCFITINYNDYIECHNEPIHQDVYIHQIINILSFFYFVFVILCNFSIIQYTILWNFYIINR